MRKNKNGRGWHDDPVRHGLAAQGVKTSVRACNAKQSTMNEEEIKDIVDELPYNWKDETTEMFWNEENEKMEKLGVDVKIHQTEEKFDTGYGNEGRIQLMANWAPLFRYGDMEEAVELGEGKWYVYIFDCMSGSEKEKVGERIVEKLEELGQEVSLVNMSGY